MIITIFAITVLVAVIAGCYGRYHQNRANNLDKCNKRLHACIDEHLETTEMLLEEFAAMERRNVWLEERRHIICRKWGQGGQRVLWKTAVDRFGVWG